ncbi:30S ribosomal protein S2 [Candidatus Marinamargulisbacteria bacterium SCGC AG-343-D04]|nr:30S ribosomal protein S2 [Candidatus Marinamargulisbacteria bacterium SCGC AG-343-D04]
MRQLLECGVHFGHQTKRWDPKMKKYIFTSRNGIHVIDLQQSIQLINIAYAFIKEIIKNNGSVLFVGTKKQAQDAIKTEAERCDMPYVNHRWLGGTLTNISTIRQSINKLKDFERLQEDGILDQLSNKEKAKKTKAYNKLLHNLEGIKNMIKIPTALFIVDIKKEQLAIKEAQKLKIPIIGIVDTNANPNEVDYPIPANDDAIRAVKLLCSIMANGILEGQKDIIHETEKKKSTVSEAKEEAKKETKEEAKKETKEEAKKETKKETKEEAKKEAKKEAKEEAEEIKEKKKKTTAKTKDIKTEEKPKEKKTSSKTKELENKENPKTKKTTSSKDKKK